MKMLLDYKKYVGALIIFLPSLAIADKIHDPTKPKNLNPVMQPVGSAVEVSESNSAMSGMLLQGIMYRKDTKIAIISEQIYAKGDKINGFIISQINNDNVVLVSSGTQKRLYIYE